MRKVIVSRCTDYALLRFGPDPPTAERFVREFDSILQATGALPRRASADDVLDVLDWAAAQGWGEWR